MIITNNNWKQKYSKNVRFNLFIILTAIGLVALLNLPVAFLNGKYSSGSSSSSKSKPKQGLNQTTINQQNQSFLVTTDEYAYTTAKILTEFISTTTSLSTLIPIHVAPSRKRVECYTTSYIIYYQKLTFLFECVIPLILMILFNYLLIKRTYNSSTKFSANSQQTNHLHLNHSNNNQSNNKDSNSNVNSSNNHLNTKFNNTSHSLRAFFSRGLKKSASFHSNLSINTPNTQTPVNYPKLSITIATSDTDKLTKLNSLKKNNSLANSCYDLTQQQKSQSKRAKIRDRYLSALKHHRNSSISTRLINQNTDNMITTDISSSRSTSTIPLSTNYKSKHDTSTISMEDYNNNNKQSLDANMNDLDENVIKNDPMNSSLANLDFLQYSPSIYEKNLTYIEPDSSYYVSLNLNDNIIDEEVEIEANSNSNNKNNEDEDEEETEISKKDSDTNENTNKSGNYIKNNKSHINKLLSITNNLRHHSSSVTVNQTGGSMIGRNSVGAFNSNALDHRRMSSMRNRKIVLMLSLLTISFAVSTLPSSIFYTFFRPILNKKPYRRLLSLSFNLLRHLSHTFNFVIYFTFSSVIKQQLKETLKDLNEKLFYIVNLSFFQKFCCCLIYIIPSSMKKQHYNHNPHNFKQNKRSITTNAKSSPCKLTDNNNNNNNTNNNVIINHANMTKLDNECSFASVNSKNVQLTNKPKKLNKIKKQTVKNNKNQNNNLNSIADEHSSIDISTPNFDLRKISNNSINEQFYKHIDEKYFNDEESINCNTKGYESVSFKVPSSRSYLRKKKSNYF